MSPARVSVAMATFNGAAFVGEQLESFVEQTRRPDELVVCDDGSEDDTAELVERFAAAAPFEVRFERNPIRLHTTPNFEKAIARCTGDVVFLADQDDVWLPAKIETLCGILEAEPEVGAVFSNGRVADADLRPLDMDLWQSVFFTPREQQMVRDGRAVEVFLKHVVAAGTTLAFRSAYRELYLPFPGLRDCHDSWVAFLIAAVAQFRILDEDLITYRLHGKNRFGLRRLTLREQLALARHQLEVDAFGYGVEFFRAAGDRLHAAADPRYRASARTFELIEEKIDHFRTRQTMSPHAWRRLPGIAREALRGRYGRYSYGWKSVAQDVFLR